ncbi:unnamed protein product [Ambrosiozyma monospora]|uniref:Unnamed protein product n=1 Tax=Ambrosiozyma monospora TaxID=43982 RepID=A0ACB5TPK1_AMBMO|nr:unnamed protein product [Ambrosiozyma monospora]
MILNTGLSLLLISFFITLTTSSPLPTLTDDPEVTHEITFEIEQGGEPLGNLTLGLFGTVVPKTATNFYELSKSKYKDTIFHRVIKDFMIQGGDFEFFDGTGGSSIYGKHFPDENFDLKHDRKGRLSMANAGADTNGAQFFITSKETSYLDGKHVVFGQLTSGETTFDLIEGTETGKNNKPKKDVKIVNVEAKELKKVYDIAKAGVEPEPTTSIASPADEETGYIEDSGDSAIDKSGSSESSSSVAEEADKLLNTEHNDTEGEIKVPGDSFDTPVGESGSTPKTHLALIPLLILIVILGFVLFKVKNKLLFAFRGPRYRRL